MQFDNPDVATVLSAIKASKSLTTKDETGYTEVVKLLLNKYTTEDVFLDCLKAIATSAEIADFLALEYPNKLKLIHMVIGRGFDNCFTQLLKMGATALDTNEYGLTPFTMAGISGYETYLEHMLENCNVALTFDGFENAAGNAVATANLPGFNALQSKFGVEIMQSTFKQTGRNLWHKATCTTDSEMFEELVELEVDPTVKDVNGLTPVALALTAENLDFIEFLVDNYKGNKELEAQVNAIYAKIKDPDFKQLLNEKGFYGKRAPAAKKPVAKKTKAVAKKPVAKKPAAKKTAKKEGSAE